MAGRNGNKNKVNKSRKRENSSNNRTDNKTKKTNNLIPLKDFIGFDINNEDNHSMDTNSDNGSENSVETIMGHNKEDKLNDNPVSNNMNSTNIPNNKKMLYYSSKDKGPFNVIATKEKLHIVRLGKDLEILNINKNNIENIIRLGKNRAKIICKNISDANKILRQENQIENLLGYEFSIPENFIKTIGIIRNIPIEITKDELYQNLEVERGIEIMDIERIKKYNFDLKKEEDTEIIKISFRSNYLPPRVKLYYTLIKTQFFIPKPTFCTKCLNYGHFKKYCQTPKDIFKCRTCSEILNETHNCSKIEKCNLCEDKHKTNDRNCIYKKNEIELKKVMIKEKKSYTEARRVVPAIKKPEYRHQEKNFPTMTKTYSETLTTAPVNYDKQINEAVQNKTNNNPKYEEMKNILKKKDSFIQVTAQIISNLYDEESPAKSDTETMKILLDIYRKNQEALQLYTNY